MKHIVLIILLAISMTSIAEVVYKSVNEDGKVIFSDRFDNGAKAIKVKPAQSIEYSNQPEFISSKSRKKKAEQYYKNVTIEHPVVDSTVLSNPGSLTVTISVNPLLLSQHELKLSLDGEVVSRARELSVLLENIDRGAHSINVEIIDTNNKTVFTGKPVTFYMRRASKLNPNNAKRKNEINPLNPPVVKTNIDNVPLPKP